MHIIFESRSVANELALSSGRHVAISIKITVVDSNNKIANAVALEFGKVEVKISSATSVQDLGSDAVWGQAEVNQDAGVSFSSRAAARWQAASTRHLLEEREETLLHQFHSCS